MFVEWVHQRASLEKLRSDMQQGSLKMGATIGHTDHMTHY